MNTREVIKIIGYGVVDMVCWRIYEWVREEGPVVEMRRKEARIREIKACV